MINVSICSKPNPLKPEEPRKYYGTAQTSSTMDINAFAEHISTHGCVYSRADIAAILTMAVDCMRENLLNGTLIKLGDLGTFEISLRCTGATSAADFKTDVNIVGVSVCWTPGSRFANLLSDATFNLVPSRKMTAKILKAIKAGDTTIDLSDSDDSPSTSDDSGTSTDGTQTGDDGSAEQGGTTSEGDL